MSPKKAEPKPVIEVGGREISISSAERVVFPRDGITKGDVVEYYRSVAETMIPYVAGRPFTLHRFPDGIDGEGFYQKQAPKFFPSWIPRVTVPKAKGSTDMPVVDEPAALVYCANQNCMTPHVWQSRADDVFRPDLVMIDLDPEGDESWTDVRDGAVLLRELIDADGLVPYVKTSGSRGLHVVAPLDRSGTTEDAHKYAESLARRLIEREPDRFTLEFSKADREGRVYCDIARNAFAQHAAAAYAIRARDGAPVSMPIDWDELNDKKVNARTWTMRNTAQRLADRGDPWAGIFGDARPLP